MAQTGIQSSPAWLSTVFTVSKRRYKTDTLATSSLADLFVLYMSYKSFLPSFCLLFQYYLRTGNRKRKKRNLSVHSSEINYTTE